MRWAIALGSETSRFGQVECGNTNADFRASQAARAGASPCSSSSSCGKGEGIDATEIPERPVYRAFISLGFPDGDSPLSAAPTKLRGFHIIKAGWWGIWGTCSQLLGHAEIV